MIWAIAAIFFLLWLLGMATAYTLGGYVHAFFIASLALIVVGAYRGGMAAKVRSYVKARKVAVAKTREADGELKTKKSNRSK